MEECGKGGDPRAGARNSLGSQRRGQRTVLPLALAALGPPGGGGGGGGTEGREALSSVDPPRLPAHRAGGPGQALSRPPSTRASGCNLAVARESEPQLIGGSVQPPSGSARVLLHRLQPPRPPPPGPLPGFSARKGPSPPKQRPPLSLVTPTDSDLGSVRHPARRGSGARCRRLPFP